MMYVWSRTKYEISIKNNVQIHWTVVFIVMMMLNTLQIIFDYLIRIDLSIITYILKSICKLYNVDTDADLHKYLSAHIQTNCNNRPNIN